MPKAWPTPEPMKAKIIKRFKELNGDITIKALGEELGITYCRVSQVLTDYFQAKIK